MSNTKVDYGKVQELHEQGLKGIDIAKQLDVSRGCVSKILKRMGLEITKAAVPEAQEYVARKDIATDHLVFLANKAREELDWIEATVPPANDAEYREWQNQKLKFAAEMRKLITSMADVGYKLFQVEEVNEVLRIIDEEIGHESQGCQARIRERIQHRRDIRFPSFHTG